MKNIGKQTVPLAIITLVLTLLQANMSPLFSQLTLSNEPTTIISGATSGLSRPEGIAFSPSGDCIAIANSLGNSITFYQRLEESELHYENVPFCVIKNKNLLHYIHDLEFSPCGQFLGTVSRENHSVVFFRKLKKSLNKTTFQPRAHWRIRGTSSELNNPTGIALSPDGKIVGICNRLGKKGVTLYTKMTHQKSKYNSTPFLEITEEQLEECGLSAPHDLAFSPNGQFIAIAHKNFFKNKEPKIVGSFLSIFKLNSDQPAKLTPLFVTYLGNEQVHSVAFHPSGKYIAITLIESGVYIYEQINESNYTLCTSVHIDGDVKGIDFSPCGRCLAISIESDQVLIYDVQEENPKTSEPFAKLLQYTFYPFHHF